MVWRRRSGERGGTGDPAALCSGYFETNAGGEGRHGGRENIKLHHDYLLHNYHEDEHRARQFSLALCGTFEAAHQVL